MREAPAAPSDRSAFRGLALLVGFAFLLAEIYLAHELLVIGAMQ